MKENDMINLKVIGTAALLLAVAGPAMAESHGVYGIHRLHHEGMGQVSRRMRAQDFDHFDYGISRPTYHSGWGGPYGDGDYPGTIDQNIGSTFN